MRINEELSIVTRLDKLIAAEGHVAIFERCGHTARRLYRAGRLWRNASTLASQGKGVEAARQYFHATFLHIDQACEFNNMTPQLIQKAVNTALANLRRSDSGLTPEQREYADLSLQVQAGPLVAHLTMAFSGGRQADEAMARMNATIKMIRKARTRYATIGVPDLPREYDVWAYDLIEGENAGIENPEPKERFCSGLLDDTLLVHMLDKLGTCLMGMVALDSANRARYFTKVKSLAEEMTQLVPSSMHGWHVLGVVHARTENYADAATAYETGFKVAKDDEMEHACLLRYCHIDALLNRGQVWIAQVRGLYEEAKQLKKRLRPLRLDAGRSAEKATVKKFMTSVKDVEDGFVEKGMAHVTYKSEEEHQAKLAELRKSAGEDAVMFNVSAPEGNVFSTTCTGCNRVYEKVLRCGRCKQAKYCSTGCQRKHWPKHKADCKAPGAQ